MLQSKLLYKTQKNLPSDETSTNAKLLIQACFIKKEAAGIYSYLPMGLMVMNKIENIVREEMKKINAQEILMPGLTPKQNWVDTGRWNMSVLFKTTGSTSTEYALGASHEEFVTPIAKQFVNSYKDLPLALYQIQTKFRNEERAKSGILRGRDFRMKDMYSFHSTEEDFLDFYEKSKVAYFNVYKRVGIGDKTIIAIASGGDFTTKFSHEFQTFTEAGEDLIYVCPKCNVGINKEVIEEQKHACYICGNTELITKKAIEVGNIFPLETKYTKAFNFTFVNKDGEKQLPIMGCYGIGITRVMGAIVEVCHDENGIIWPEEIAPFKYHIITIGDSENVKAKAKEIYEKLSKNNEVLMDDRNESAGIKLKDADLIGCPIRIVISEKTIEQGSVEIKNRNEDKAKLIKIEELL